MNKTMHLLIKGRVQGVGFRNYTEKKAKLNRIRGWVRNLVDGRVEALVSGEDEALSIFLRSVCRGPELARVDEFDINEVNYNVETENFLVNPDGDSPWQKK